MQSSISAILVALASGCSSGGSDQLTLLPLKNGQVGAAFVGGSGANDLWAIGSLSAGGPGLLLHWDGSAWSQVTPASHSDEVSFATRTSGARAAVPGALWLTSSAHATSAPAIFKLAASGAIEDHTADFAVLPSIVTNGTTTYALTPASGNAAAKLYLLQGSAFVPSPVAVPDTFSFRVMPDGILWAEIPPNSMHPDPVLLRLDGAAWTKIPFPAASGGFYYQFLNGAAFESSTNISLVTTPCVDSLDGSGTTAHPGNPPTPMTLLHYDGTAVTVVNAGLGADIGHEPQHVYNNGLLGTIPLTNGAVGSLTLRVDVSDGTISPHVDLQMMVWDGMHLSKNVQLAHLYDTCYSSTCTPELIGVLGDGALLMTSRTTPGFLIGKPHP